MDPSPAAPMKYHRALNNALGFTLVELIIVIVITGILAAIPFSFISNSVQGQLDVERRAALVDNAGATLLRMQREIRQALPNSVQVIDSGTGIEFLHTVDGGRYRAAPPGDHLDFTQADNSFEVLGGLRAAPPDGSYAVVYNLAPSGPEGNAYVGDNRAAIGHYENPTLYLNAAFQFPRQSPSRRFFVVDGPICYRFESGTIMRYAGYAIAGGCPSSGGDVLAADVTGADFRYQPGTSWRAGLVTMALTLTRDGEAITLLNQAHVVNAP